MKKVAVLAVLVLTGGLVAASTAVAGDTQCVGALTGTFDNVVVPPGATCVLTNSLVLGNVKAQENSRLVINNSNIRGNVEGDKADVVQVNNSLVRENISIKEGGPSPTPLVGAVLCQAGAPCEALVLSTTVQEGNVQIEKMVGSVAVVLSPVLKGNVKIEENFIQAPEFMNISSQSIAENLQVFKNRGSGGKFVFSNTVGESIQCFENDLPFFGGPNTAPKKEGQCF